MMRALMVLEESSVQRMLAEYLESRSFDLTYCASPTQAFRLCQTSRFHLILIDSMAYDVLFEEDGESVQVDGTELCRRIRTGSHHALAVVVMLTASRKSEVLRKHIEAGADDALTLPMEPDQLFARMYMAEQRCRLMDRLCFQQSSEQQTESLYTIADSSPVMIWIADGEGHGNFFNRSYLEYTGRRLEQELGMAWSECLHPEDYSRCVDIYLTSIRLRQEFRIEYRLRCTDGSYRWVLSAGVPRRDASGNFLGYIGSCVDISEHKRSEAILRESEERLRLVVKNMPVMMVAFDERNRLVVWNRECERVTGYLAEEVICNPELMERLAPHEPCRDEILLKWANPEAAYRNWEMELYCQGGELRSVAWSNITEELSISGWNSWAIGVDVTARKSSEEQRSRLELKIQNAQKLQSLSVLAGGVAHDFNNLLMSILGKADLARLKLDPQHPARPLVEEVELAAQLAANLTNQMLAYSGKGRFEVQPLNLSTVVAGMRTLLEAGISKDIQLHFELDEKIPAIEGDPTQVQQVAMNLINNAAEAIGETVGDITVRSGNLWADSGYFANTFLEEEHEPGLYSYLSVADSGCGMSAETVAKIFDPFFTTKFVGRGLGLAALLGIVRGHRGAVRVTSQLGQGSEFTILFPSLKQELGMEDIEPKVANGAVGELDLSSELTFLIVEDEEEVRGVAKSMLESFGFKVLIAEDGASGVQAYKKHSNRLSGVLLDMTMPNMNGEDALIAMQKINGNIPVIVSSGYSEQDIGSRFHNGGPAGFLQKPYTSSGLLDKVREVLKAASEKI